MKTNKKDKKDPKKVISKGKKTILIVLGIILLMLVILAGYKVCTKHLFNTNNDDNKITVPEKQTIELDNYDYYLHGNATDYEKELAEELKKILSNEEINWEEYAKTLSKMFISDLFTLNNKNGSSDITSSQYVYNEYQDTFKKMIKDTIYENIEVDLNGTRQQDLPTVINVEIISIESNQFLYNNEILDSNAYFVSTKIEYDKDLGYPTNYNVVLVKNEDLLQIVKAN